MSDPNEMHEKAWATRGLAPFPEEEEEKEETVSRETEPLRTYRPGRQEDLPEELVLRYDAARRAVIQREEGAAVLLKRVTDEMLEHVSYEDTEALVRGEAITEEVGVDPPWEVGEVLDIKDAGWKTVCQAVVLEASPPAYRLRGVLPGRLDD